MMSEIEKILNCKIEISNAEFLVGLNWALQMRTTPREEKCIKEKYIEEKTLEEIGKELGVTRERIRQIIAKGMRKVRSWNNTKHILDKGIKWYVENEVAKAVEETKQRYESLLTNYEINSIMNQDIEDLNLSIRAYNCLKRANINTIYELSRTSKVKLRRIRNLGTKSIKEIINKLKEYDIEIKNTEEEQEGE